MDKLFSRHEIGFQTEYQSGAQAADTSEAIPIGTPGSIEARTRGNEVYFYRRFYDATGKPREEYVGGPAGSDEGEVARRLAQEKIDRATMLVGFVKKIRKLGFQCVEDKAGATLAAIHNSGLFAGGLTLIGSHAYGVLLNSLGIVARSSLTEDIDLARLRPLHLAGGSISILETLRSSGLPFMEVSTGLDHRSKNKTLTLPGADRLLVDILVSGNNAGKAVHVPKIQVFAQEIPLLDYLATGNMAGVVLSKNYVIPVFVPQPSRFALHKLFSSQSRKNQLSKSEKDLRQAATIIAAIEEVYPGDIGEAMLRFPKEGVKKMLIGAKLITPLLSNHAPMIAEAFSGAIEACEHMLLNEPRDEDASVHKP